MLKRTRGHHHRGRRTDGGRGLSVAFVMNPILNALPEDSSQQALTPTGAGCSAP